MFSFQDIWVGRFHVKEGTLIVTGDMCLYPYTVERMERGVFSFQDIWVGRFHVKEGTLIVTGDMCLYPYTVERGERGECSHFKIFG